ncbi:flagellin, partial [Terribacillus saccharophilus]|uniref:flagellin N-terminal helical domain-containing protein n=1 Tax=Terribacillus saccharophilus TaxID=361277 RepID=UPI003D26A885
MRINHNIAALNTYNKLSANSTATQGSLEKLSSGLKINKAGDDAAGLAISEKMRGQIRGLDMASKNAQDGISLIQTAEGALNETHSILQRMRELSVQSSSDSNNDNDRAELQKEVDQLSQEITRISTDTEFNTKKLINGTATDLTFHIGANEGQSINLSIGDMGAQNLGVARNGTSAEGTSAGTDFFATGGSASEITVAGSFDLSIDGKTAHSITVDSSVQSVNDLASKINTAIGNEGTASVKEGKLVITSATSGTTSNVTVNNFTEATDGADAVTALETFFGTGGLDEDGTATIDTTKGINISNKTAADAAITTIQTAIDT